MNYFLSRIKAYQREYGFFKSIPIIFKKYRNRRKTKRDLKYKNVKKIDDEYSSLLDLSKPKDIEIPKVIYFFWYDGMFHMPTIPQMCIKQLHKLYSKDYKIVFVDKDNYKSLVNIDSLFVNAFESKQITIQTFSDILRFSLLSQNGGVWIDSTVFIPKRIEFAKLAKEGFYSFVTNEHFKFFKYKEYEISWSTFIIATSKNHPISNNMVKLFKEYIVRNKTNNIYFLVDIFLMLNYINKVGNDCISKNKESNLIQGDFTYLAENLNAKFVDKVIEECFKCPQKLNWRFKVAEYKTDSLIKYVFRLVENEN